MFIDERTLPTGHRVEADVCIVRMEAGIATARVFARTTLDVYVLENGGDHTREPAPS